MIYIRRELPFRAGDCDSVIEREREREEIRYNSDYLHIGRGEGPVWLSSYSSSGSKFLFSNEQFHFFFLVNSLG